MEIHLKRAYEAASPEDGFRVYVDRLWPRGLSHDKFHYDVWEKDIAPSTELRQWFHADPKARWQEFASRYRDELKRNAALKNLTDTLAKHKKVTLLYSAHDQERNNARILADYLLRLESL